MHQEPLAYFVFYNVFAPFNVCYAFCFQKVNRDILKIWNIFNFHSGMLGTMTKFKEASYISIGTNQQTLDNMCSNNACPKCKKHKRIWSKYKKEIRIFLSYHWKYLIVTLSQKFLSTRHPILCCQCNNKMLQVLHILMCSKHACTRNES